MNCKKLNMKCKNTSGDWKKDIFQKRKPKQLNKKENKKTHPKATPTKKKNPDPNKQKNQTKTKNPKPHNSSDLAFLVLRSQGTA